MNETKHKNTRSKHRLAGCGILASILILLMLLVAIAYAATNIWPALGAGTVDLARSMFGDQFVSAAENFVLSSEDTLKQIQYTLLKTTPTAPWQTASLPAKQLTDSPSSSN